MASSRAIARARLTHQTRRTPYIHTLRPTRPQYNLRTPILPRLDIIRKVVIDPTSVTKIGNLDGYPFQGDWVVGERRGEHVGVTGNRRDLVSIVCRGVVL